MRERSTFGNQKYKCLVTQKKNGLTEALVHIFFGNIRMR